MAVAADGADDIWLSLMIGNSRLHWMIMSGSLALLSWDSPHLSRLYAEGKARAFGEEGVGLPLAVLEGLREGGKEPQEAINLLLRARGDDADGPTAVGCLGGHLVMAPSLLLVASVVPLETQRWQRRFSPAPQRQGQEQEQQEQEHEEGQRQQQQQQQSSPQEPQPQHHHQQQREGGCVNKNAHAQGGAGGAKDSPVVSPRIDTGTAVGHTVIVNAVSNTGAGTPVGHTQKGIDTDTNTAPLLQPLRCLSSADALAGVYASLGVDRALAVRGAGVKRGWPVMVVDCGSALTFTAADRHASLVGGSILPGIRLQCLSLNANTAQLPNTHPSTSCSLPVGEGADSQQQQQQQSAIQQQQQQHLETQPGFPERWARSTEGAIHSGVVHCLVAGLESFIQDWWSREPQSSVCFTGGDAPLLFALVKQQGRVGSLAQREEHLHHDPEIIHLGIAYCRGQLRQRSD